MTRVSSDLSTRYGAPRTWQRPAVIIVSVLVVAAFLGWLAWAVWFHATPEVRSELGTYTVDSSSQVTVVVDVQLDEGAEDVECRVSALASDHSAVGELVFEPEDGRNERSFRTERLADAVSLVGCTAKGQPRPQ